VHGCAEVVYCEFLQMFVDHRALHSFPTRRSSDLQEQLMYSEKEKIAYALIEKNNRLFLEFDSSDYPNFKRMNQIIALNNHSFTRSEEHTSELQSRENLVCRLLLEKKN